MLFIYNLGIKTYTLAIQIASLFNAKARLWVDGRKNIFKKLKNTINPNDHIIWFHVSSLGEFEQGRPVIEAFKKKFPDYKILLTFFSPSGYEIRKDYPGADYIFYLPSDSKSNARQFLKIVNPKLAYFVKYEFWYHYLNQLQKQNIPTYIFSSIFRPEQHFFKSYGKWYRKSLYAFKTIYVQNKESEQLLKSININNVVVAGDTRFDRVFDIARESKPLPVIEKFTLNQKIIIAGSTWEKDEELIANYFKLHPEVKWIIAPHEIHETHIQKIETLFADKCIKYSKANEVNISNFQILIIDSIGLLSSLYKYGQIAYIGGGFGVGIHNTLEAATYGVPVVFGPNYHRFQEACDLIEKKAGFSIKSNSDFNDIINKLLSDESCYNTSGNAALSYVNSMRGGTQKILSDLTV